MADSPAALLRAAARIVSADAALLLRASEVMAVYGLSEGSAHDALVAIEGGLALPAGLGVVWHAHVPSVDEAPRELYLLKTAPLEIDDALARVLRVMANELGYAVDVWSSGSRRGGPPLVLGDRVEQLATTIDSLADPVALCEAPRVGNVARFVYINPAFEQFFGYSITDVIGQTPDFLYGELTDRDRLEFILDRLRTGTDVRSQIVCYKRDGIPVWIELHAKPVVEPNGAISLHILTLRDVTARKEFEAALGQEKRKLQATLAAIGDAVITTVRDGRIEFVNPAARTVFSIDPIESYGENIAKIVALHDYFDVPIDLLEGGELSESGTRRGVGRLTIADGTVHVAFTSSPFGAGPEGYVVVLRDVTEAHRLASQLSFEAAHDALTGLINRRRFEEALADTVVEARRGRVETTLAFLDLDRFKAINDRCGHAAGDRVLADIANVLARKLRERDILARVGGDEFAVILYDCPLATARRVMNKLRDAVDAYIYEAPGGEQFRIGISIGIAAIDRTAGSPSAVLAVADAACYAAKAAGRNMVVG
jgi:diguanylate cyclase (GGDEF)-like protein/PAS domain S-box-containing protein